MYLVSDLLDSQQRHLHVDIFNPCKQRQNLEKFPVIIVPKRYWKTWEGVVKTIYQSTLSSQIPGPTIRKEHCIWLQHDDRSHIIRNCGNHKYVKYKLLQHTRKIQKYTRVGWYHTTIYELGNYKVIKVYERDGTIMTDGYTNTGKSSAFHNDHTNIPLYVRMQLQWKNIYNAWKNKINTEAIIPTIPVHFQITQSILDSDATLVVHELCMLEPALQRNIGNITKMENVRKLANAIETGDIITISDASNGTRYRAAHSFILSTKNSNCEIYGSAPVDCDIDDIESTRAEIFGGIAIHTILLALSNAFAITSGEVVIYCDNKDALCKNKIGLSDISFPCLFRPNVDPKLQIQTLRQQLEPIQILPIHIKGHQDDDGDFDYDTAPLSVKLNIEVDIQSKLYLKKHKGKMEPQQSTPTLPAMKSFLSINNSTIQNNLEHHVRLNYFGPQLETRLLPNQTYQIRLSSTFTG